MLDVLLTLLLRDPCDSDKFQYMDRPQSSMTTAFREESIKHFLSGDSNLIIFRHMTLKNISIFKNFLKR